MARPLTTVADQVAWGFYCEQRGHTDLGILARCGGQSDEKLYAMYCTAHRLDCYADLPQVRLFLLAVFLDQHFELASGPDASLGVFDTLRAASAMALDAMHDVRRWRELPPGPGREVKAAMLLLVRQWPDILHPLCHPPRHNFTCPCLYGLVFA